MTAAERRAQQRQQSNVQAVQIYRMKQAGMNNREIADSIRRSSERVRQILAKIERAKKREMWNDETGFIARK